MNFIQIYKKYLIVKIKINITTNLLAVDCNYIDSYIFVKGSENQNRTGGLGVMSPTLSPTKLSRH